jgi:hypothetical protein
MYGPEYLNKNPPGGFYTKYLGKNPSDLVDVPKGYGQPGEYTYPGQDPDLPAGAISPEEALAFKGLGPSMRRFIKEQQVWRKAMNRQEEEDSPFRRISKDSDDVVRKKSLDRHETEDDDNPFKTISKDPDDKRPENKDDFRADRNKSPKMKVNKPDDSQFDVKKEYDNGHHAEHDASPSKDDDSGSEVTSENHSADLDS